MFRNPTSPKPQNFRSIILSITLAALALRVWGAGWSLPYVDHPDEPAIVQVLLRMLKGDLNPKHFFYPSLILYLQALVFKIHFVWGNLIGMYSDSFTLPNSAYFYTTIPNAFVWSRIVTALLGTGTVLTMATWGQLAVGKREALLAAALLAFSPWAIVHDHYLTVDGPSAFTGIVALMGALQILRTSSWRTYILAGVLIGLAAGTKYQNVLVAASVALAHGLHWRNTSVAHIGRLMSAAVVSAIVFLLTTPYIVLAPQDFMHDIQTLLNSYSSADIAHGDVTGAWPVAAYLHFYWHECLQPLPCLLAILGGIVLTRRSPSTAAVLLLFPTLMFLSLLRPETHFYRNLLPTQPPLMLLSGIGGIAVLDWARQQCITLKREKRPVPQATTNRRLFCTAITTYAGIALLLLPSVYYAIQASARLAQPDSRVLAQRYMRDIWPGTRVASEVSHPMKWDNVTQSTYVHYLPLHPVEWYYQQGFGLLLANDSKRGKEPWTEDYAPLLDRGDVVASFGGEESGILGPRIDVIDIHLTRQDIPPGLPPTTLGPLSLVSYTVGERIKEKNILRMEPGRTIKPGRTLAFNIFWMLEEPVPPAPYTVFIHVRNAQGDTVAQRDAQPWQGLFPPETWPLDTVIAERMDIWLPYEVPPGDYQLVMGLYDSANLLRFPAFQNKRHLENDEVELGSIEVVPW